MQLTQQNAQISQFAALVQQGIAAWVSAGEILVTILDADPCAVDKICGANPWITPEVVFRFEQIGRKQVSPQLMLSDAPGVRKLRAMPLSQQEKFAAEPIELLVHEDGKTDVLKVHVKNLTASQSQQVFAKDHIRDIAEQRAFMFDKSASTLFPAIEKEMPYRIKKGSVQFTKNCTLSAKEVAEILSNIQT